MDKYTIADEIQNRIKNAKTSVEILDRIEPIMAMFEGKKITKRIETKLKTLFPEYRIYYYFQYGMYKLDISYNGCGLNLLLAYESDPTFTMEKYLKHNIGYYLNKERLEKYREGQHLADEWYVRYTELSDAIKQLRKDMSKYNCEYIVKWDTMAL